jgi:uncharacterized protein (TIGR03435 family)
LSIPKFKIALIAGIFPLAFTQTVCAQAPAYTPSMTFDVASIRQSNPDLTGGFFRVGGDFSPANSSHLSLENVDLWYVLEMAYPIDGHRIVGLRRLPILLQHATFNMKARAGEAMDEKLASLPKEQRVLEQQHMIQVLLTERFNIKVHLETRDSATYDLVVAKKGKLRTTGEPPTADEVAGFGDSGVPAIDQEGDTRSGFQFIAHGASTSDIVEILSGQLGVPVNDKTGLTGHYYFDLKTYQTKMSDRAIDETNPWPPLETAIQDQLGLKLVPSHGPVVFLVIDHAEMPTAN